MKGDPCPLGGVMYVCVCFCVHGEQTSGGAGASDVDVADVDVACDAIVIEVFKLSDPQPLLTEHALSQA
ncbi:unnamed protein product [Ectocarpus sp. CCAP 1310/34]|nr:unnamed protein product [Ectocarpus sp. CCAP 1310/34]